MKHSCPNNYDFGVLLRVNCSPPFLKKPIDKAMENQIEIYTTRDNETAVEVRFDQETVWLSQEHLTLLFQRDQSLIFRHINNVFKEGELDKRSNMQKMHIANSDKPVAFVQI